MSTESFEGFAQSTGCGHSFSSLVRVFLRSMESHGYTNVVLFRTKAGRLAAMPVAQLEEDLANCYLSKKHEQINPIFEYMRYPAHPFFWMDMERQGVLTPEQYRMMAEFEKVGAVSGLTIPLPSLEGEQAMVCLSGEQPEKILSEDLPIINAKCMQFWLALHKLDGGEKVKNDDLLQEILTPRELECLELCLHHETTRSIAQSLDRAEQTVQFHISNAIHKLGVQNRTQAVARACMLGLVGKSLKAD